MIEYADNCGHVKPRPPVRTLWPYPRDAEDEDAANTVRQERRYQRQALKYARRVMWAKLRERLKNPDSIVVEVFRRLVSEGVPSTTKECWAIWDFVNRITPHNSRPYYDRRVAGSKSPLLVGL